MRAQAQPRRARAVRKLTRRRKQPIPPPPPPDAANLTKLEACGLLRITVRRLDELRRRDTTFPAPRLISGGTARFRRVELEQWFESLPKGWCNTGGRREGAFGRPAGAGSSAA